MVDFSCAVGISPLGFGVYDFSVVVSIKTSVELQNLSTVRAIIQS